LPVELNNTDNCDGGGAGLISRAFNPRPLSTAAFLIQNQTPDVADILSITGLASRDIISTVKTTSEFRNVSVMVTVSVGDGSERGWLGVVGMVDTRCVPGWVWSLHGKQT